METMAKPLDSDVSIEKPETARRIPAWFKVSAIAAASALAGGLAAAWFYRKSLLHLQNAEFNPENTNFGISGPDEIEED